MFKKTTKFIAGVALLVQSLSALVMFFITLGKKRSSGAWLALSAITGAAGGYLVYDSKKVDDEDLADDSDDDGDDEDVETEDDEIDIDEGNLFSRNDEAEAE
ncbi:MAG: hypothetical protein IKP68_03035 [Clostridia bacterium]|nr:hypothetical protein [Clostridia bacterium]MBR7082662.1 hypothetical protein [Clostridia bacterium]